MPITVEEYLRSSYDPDCDFIEGEVVERNGGEWSHGRFQVRLAGRLLANERQWRICGMMAVRLRIAGDRYRVPDIMVVSDSAPFEKVVVTPPRLCIEILSPGDTLNKIWDRIEDYLNIGVPVCWIVDPETGSAWTATSAGLNKISDGILRAGEIEVPLSEVLN
jgi:Uma2 family endonuclease